MTVNFSTVDGTAQAGSDYAAKSGVLTFDPGELTKTIVITVNGDNLNEADEVFFVHLGNAVNAGVVRELGVGSIIHNDDVPSISINATTAVTEGDSGTVSAVFTASLSNPSQSVVTVDFSTSDGTAKAGLDYTTSSGRLTFAPGTTMQTITVMVTGDLIDESDETFTVTLANAVNASLGSATSTATIIDNDGLPSIMISNATTSEPDTGAANVMFPVSLSHPSQATVTVDFATEDDTATAGSDYTAATGTLSFAPGETTKTVMVALVGDVLAEQNETFSVRLSNASSSALLAEGTRGIGTIIDNDGLQVSISDATVSEGMNGTVDAVFTVRLSFASASPFK